MPLIFRESKINLNITLRSITSGMPLRALDIMGAGGFLLSNYQQELAENYIDGEELVLKILSVCYPIPKYLYGNYMLPDWIKVTSHSRNEESGFQSMEMLEINLTISPNNTDSVRKCDLMFTDCGAGNVDANAKVTISQPPK